MNGSPYDGLSGSALGGSHPADGLLDAEADADGGPQEDAEEQGCSGHYNKHNLVEVEAEQHL